jgi:chorismate mutase
MLLTHEAGVLSSVLQTISNTGASVLTITQSLPIHGKASVTISLDVGTLSGSINSLIQRISMQKGVENPRLIAVE